MLMGVNICSTDRMRKALARSPFLRSELFSEAERSYCEGRRAPAMHYAARWAAKEAFLDAHRLSPLRYDLSRLEVLHGEGGEPWLRVGCPELERDLAAAAKEPPGTTRLSISHERDYAVACVLVTP